MPRLTHSVPKYRKHRASGQAICTINSRRYYLGPHGTKASKLEYDRLITEWLASGRSFSFGVPEHAVTVLELIVAYLEYARSYYGEGQRGEFANMRHALRPLRQLYGRIPAREFTPRHLKAVRERFIEAGHSRKYINSTGQRICRVFRWGVAEGLVPPDVPQALAMLPGLRKGHTTAREGRKVRPVDEALVAVTLPHLSSVVRAMVELQQATGMRPGELCILRPCDIERLGNVWEYGPMHHKTENREQERVIYIGPKAQKILRPYLLRDSEAFCFSPAEAIAEQLAERHAARKVPITYGNRPGTNVVLKPKRKAGERYTTQSYGRAITRACEVAFPVPTDIADDSAEVAKWKSEHRWSPNQLRHALATKVRREHGIEAAKVLLGHSQLNTTGIYAEADRQRAIEVTRQIG